MTKEEARLVFDYPYREVLNFALSLVNLKDKERQAVQLADIDGKGEERAAEIMDISVRSVSTLKKTAYSKMCMVWDNNPLILHMIETAKRQG